MFTKTRRIYEVLAYTDPTRQPYPTELHKRKADALRTAATWAVRFKRVEVNAVYVDVEDDANVVGADLVAAWENGAPTTKTTK